MKHNLHLVSRGAERIDITMLLRADIRARDWERVMIAGDRAKPVDLSDPIRGAWS
jgi:hypothetical protein